MRGLQKPLGQKGEGKRPLVLICRSQQVRQLPDREELSVNILEILIFKVPDGPFLDIPIIFFIIVFVVVYLSLCVESETTEVLHVFHLPTGCLTHHLTDLRHLNWLCIISSLRCGFLSFVSQGSLGLLLFRITHLFELLQELRAEASSEVS